MAVCGSYGVAEGDGFAFAKEVEIKITDTIIPGNTAGRRGIGNTSTEPCCQRTGQRRIDGTATPGGRAGNAVGNVHQIVAIHIIEGYRAAVTQILCRGVRSFGESGAVTGNDRRGVIGACNGDADLLRRTVTGRKGDGVCRSITRIQVLDGGLVEGISPGAVYEVKTAIAVIANRRGDIAEYGAVIAIHIADSNGTCGCFCRIAHITFIHRPGKGACDHGVVVRTGNGKGRGGQHRGTVVVTHPYTKVVSDVIAAIQCVSVSVAVVQAVTHHAGGDGNGCRTVGSGFAVGLAAITAGPAILGQIYLVNTGGTIHVVQGEADTRGVSSGGSVGRTACFNQCLVLRPWGHRRSVIGAANSHCKGCRVRTALSVGQGVGHRGLTGCARSQVFEVAVGIKTPRTVTIDGELAAVAASDGGASRHRGTTVTNLGDTEVVIVRRAVLIVRINNPIRCIAADSALFIGAVGIVYRHRRHVVDSPREGSVLRTAIAIGGSNGDRIGTRYRGVGGNGAADFARIGVNGQAGRQPGSDVCQCVAINVIESGGGIQRDRLAVITGLVSKAGCGRRVILCGDIKGDGVGGGIKINTAIGGATVIANLESKASIASAIGVGCRSENQIAEIGHGNFIPRRHRQAVVGQAACAGQSGNNH